MSRKLKYYNIRCTQCITITGLAECNVSVTAGVIISLVITIIVVLITTARMLASSCLDKTQRYRHISVHENENRNEYYFEFEYYFHGFTHFPTSCSAA